MPIFEYACNQCEQRFEKLLRKTDQQVDCPKCQSQDLRKLFSTFASPAADNSAPADYCPPGGCGACPNPGMCMN
jgi:putative FmdB family regulatory protein